MVENLGRSGSDALTALRQENATAPDREMAGHCRTDGAFRVVRLRGLGI